MEITPSRFTARNTRIATRVALGGFAVFLAVPSVARPVALALLVAAALAVVVLSLGWVCRRVGSTGSGVVAALSAVGLVGSVLYLDSLADEPSAIPLVGSGVLLLSLLGLVVSALTLRERR